MITIKQKGSFDNTERFLSRAKRRTYLQNLDKYAQEGLQALIENTPVDSGKTADSWRFEIKKQGGAYSITYLNDNINNGVNVAIILQYGHGTGTGGYVEGIDYINPALKPVFDAIADKAWKEVTR